MTLSLANNTSDGTLGGTLTVPAVDGVATFTGLTINNPQTGYNILATSNALATASTVTVTAPGIATRLVVTSEPASVVEAGNSVTLVVSAEDGSGTIDTSFTGNVTLVLDNLLGQPSTLGGTLTVAAVNGVASFSGLMVGQEGQGYSIQASSTGVDPGTTVPFAVLFFPSFSGLSAPSITLGTNSATISGSLDANAGGQNVPSGESVLITLDGITQAATLDSSDNFSATFSTTALGVGGSPYTISLSYIGDAIFDQANGSTMLTVDQVPAITSAASITFAVGTAGSFTVTDTGFPAPTLSEVGAAQRCHLQPQHGRPERHTSRWIKWNIQPCDYRCQRRLAQRRPNAYLYRDPDWRHQRHGLRRLQREWSTG